MNIYLQKLQDELRENKLQKKLTKPVKTNKKDLLKERREKIIELWHSGVPTKTIERLFKVKKISPQLRVWRKTLKLNIIKRKSGHPSGTFVNKDLESLKNIGDFTLIPANKYSRQNLFCLARVRGFHVKTRRIGETIEVVRIS